MYILGQTGEIIVNSNRTDFIYVEQQGDATLAIKAWVKNLNITLGRYKTELSVTKAMADLSLALIAGDSGRMNIYMMRSDEDLQETKQETQAPDHGG